MSKNGGEPHDNILTLEEALRRFKRAREIGPRKSENSAESNIRYADFASRRDQVKSGAPAKPSAEPPAKPCAEPPDLFCGLDQDGEEPLNQPEQIIAIIDGIPRSFEELQRLAAAEEAFRKDFPDVDDADIETTDTIDEPALPPAMTGDARRRWTRDFAISAVGAALMICAAIFVTRPSHLPSATPGLISQSFSTQPLKASSVTDFGDSITTLVILADSDIDLSSARQIVKPTELEARVKLELKSRAFPDIGVSVGARGETYLAGQVFSLDEAQTITNIVKRVRGVRRAHFLHPDVTSPDGPAYFGVTTAWALDVWGAKVQAVFIGSPADKAGIQPGDVISEFDGKTVPDANAFNNLVATYSPGQRVQFRVWHDGQPQYLVARMGELTTVAAR